ncbi:hypothetical protein M408DRAFT_31265 [Serendipita vermifera MAFF 305830]|uniref:Uncharacterized protein n=1 Tax=Serendipita vermifera MAFF 305830 TaxID=933852 RepID=A0A0C3A3Y8_SERVB|nr:hypothetical protein M408DRAFT_31265 [Serendipita vermifera MAFF 305830]
MKRVRERDRAIKELVVAMKAARLATVNQLAESSGTQASSSASQVASKVKKGRRGVATAKFSLRDKPAPSTPKVIAPDFGPAGLSISALEKIRILPPLTKLKSLCVTTFAPPTLELTHEWDDDFERGWREGVTVLAGARRRLESGVRMKLMSAWKFADEGEQLDGRGMGELNGLVELSEEEWSEELERADLLGLNPPRLCFAGRQGEDNKREKSYKMPSYRVRPGAIPKHLKMPAQPSAAPAAARPSKVKPPIRKATASSSPGMFDNASDPPADPFATSTSGGKGTVFQLPRFRASRESWAGRSGEYRDAAKAHPYAKLKDPLSVRAYDWIVRLSVPG